MIRLLFLIFNFTVLVLAGAGTSQDLDYECNQERRCGKVRRGPAVRFPFRLRDHHPLRCGYPDPGFELSCDENRRTILNLPRSAKLFVKNINYTSQKMELYDPDSCLPKQILSNPNLNVSESLFRFAPIEGFSFENVVLFNCSLGAGDRIDERVDDSSYIPCLSTAFYGVRAVYDFSSVLSLTGCRKIDFPTLVPAYFMYSLFESSLYLNWSEPNCMKCESERRRCRLKQRIQGTETETECFGPPKKSGTKTKILMTGAILGSLLLIVGAIGIFTIHRFFIPLKRENEIKIKRFLEDYKALKATRYSYNDLWRITYQFKEKLGQGAFGTVYKGKLINNILVAVKILNKDAVGNGEEFINEVGAMGRIHHVNVARLVGFCADGANRALVYEFMPNASLEKFLCNEGSGKRVMLDWEKLRDISLGIAKGLEYLHHNCDQQILHFDIKPHNILLDQNFIPKISDFGLAKFCSKEKSVVTVTAARGTMGYIAPEVASRNFGKPSHKSDVYSFGMLLLEMVGRRRKNIDTNTNNPNEVSYFPEWVYNDLDRGEELGIEIEEEEHAKIAKKLAIVALKCVQWQPMDRPSMKDVVQMLEGDGNHLNVPPNPFAATYGTETIDIRQTKPKNVELKTISEAD